MDHFQTDYLLLYISGQRKDLNIRVTNPENAFMLYSLKLNEDDYHNLKTQQGLSTNVAL